MRRSWSSRGGAATLLPLVGLAVLASCSGGSGGTDVVAPAHDVDILQGAPQLGPNAYSPTNAVISISAQGSVTWYNADFGLYGGSAGTSHHLKSDDGTTFESSAIAPNGVFRATFTAPGTYTYHCEFHSGMTGTITVNPESRSKSLKDTKVSGAERCSSSTMLSMPPSNHPLNCT